MSFQSEFATLKLMQRSLNVQPVANERAATSLPPLYKRYRFIALATYAAVLLAGFSDALVGGIGSNSLIHAPEGFRFVMFLLAMLSLLGLELKAVGALSFVAPWRAELPQLTLRLLFFLTVFALGDPKYSQVLFLVFILYLYLGVSKRVTYVFAVLGVIALLNFGLNVSPPPSLQLPPSAERSSSEQLEPRPLTLGRVIDEGFSLFTIVFFTFLLARAMARAAHDQQDLETLHSSLESSHKQLQVSSYRVAELAATEERNRVARDVHDSLGHHLVAINIQLEKANAYSARDPKRAQDAVKQAQRTVQDALKDVRESVASLRQETDKFSFQTALSDLLARMRHSELEINLHQAGNSSSFSKHILMTLYRVIQEGLTNIHKHADASLVTLSLDFSASEVRLDLTDNGSGFDVDAWEASTKEQRTYGLIGLRERVGLVGGKLSIMSQPRETRLTVIIPKSDSKVQT